MSEEEVLEEKQTKVGWIIIILALFTTLFPLYWMLATSLKPQGEWVTAPPVWIPSRLAIENYIALFTGAAYGGAGGIEETFVLRITPIIPALIDSVVIAGLGTALSIFLGTLAAFGVSRHKIGGEFFPLFLLSARMVPPVVAIIPLIILYSTLHLVDTHLGLILAYALFTSPYSMWMIKSFIDEIPRELEESAMVDGLSTLGSHFKVTLPLIRGGVAATAMFVLILNWSEFLLALSLTHGTVVTIPIQEKFYFTFSGPLYGPQSALGILAIIPLLVFSYSIQRYLVRGLTFGAIKK
jgi:multiple sugar transport system permease protein